MRAPGPALGRTRTPSIVGVGLVVRYPRQCLGQIRHSRTFSVDPPDPFATGCRIFPISDVDPLVERPPIGFAPRFQLRPARSIAKLPIPHFPRHAASLSNDLTKIRERTTADKQKQTFTIQKLYC